jgi:hypothetical protein
MADSECVNNIGVVLGTGIGMGQPVWLQKQDFTAASPDDPSAQVHYLWVRLSNLNEFSVCEGRGWHDCMTARVHGCGGWGLSSLYLDHGLTVGRFLTSQAHT